MRLIPNNKVKTTGRMGGFDFFNILALKIQYIFEKQSLENDNLAEFIPDDMDEKKIEGLKFENYCTLDYKLKTKIRSEKINCNLLI